MGQQTVSIYTVMANVFRRMLYDRYAKKLNQASEPTRER
jgi:hypothetical protein